MVFLSKFQSFCPFSLQLSPHPGNKDVNNYSTISKYLITKREHKKQVVENCHQPAGAFLEGRKKKLSSCAVRSSA